MNPDCHPVEQQARQNALDAAYLADPRSSDPSHPYYSTYTGLMTTEPQPEAVSLEDQLAAWWRSSYPNATLNAQTGQMMVAFGAWLLEQNGANNDN